MQDTANNLDSGSVEYVRSFDDLPPLPAQALAFAILTWSCHDATLFPRGYGKIMTGRPLIIGGTEYTTRWGESQGDWGVFLSEDSNKRSAGPKRQRHWFLPQKLFRSPKRLREAE